MAFKKGQSGNLKGRPKEENFNIKISDFFTYEEKAEFLRDMKDRAKKDPRIAIWLGDHIFGKAPQPITGTGESGEIILKWTK